MSMKKDKGAGTFQADAAENDQGYDQGAGTVEKVPAPYTGVTPGQLLREVREARGQTLAEVAAALRLRVGLIEAIEADDYEQLKGSTFVRGYFRSLARLYDIDAKPLAEAYEAMGYGAPSVSTLKMQSFSRRKIREKNDGRLMLVSYVIIAVVIGAAGWWWWQQQSSADRVMPERSSIEAQPREVLTGAQVAEQQREAERLEAERLAAERAVAEQTGVNQEGGQPLTAAEQLAAERLAAELSDAERAAAVLSAAELSAAERAAAERAAAERRAAARAAEQQALAQQQVPAPLASLSMVFSQQCWVKVTDASGSDIAIGVKDAGYEMPLTGRAPFDIILCKPEAVVMTFNGNQVDLSQYRRNRSVTLRLE